MVGGGFEFGSRGGIGDRSRQAGFLDERGDGERDAGTGAVDGGDAAGFVLLATGGVAAAVLIWR